MNPSVIQFIANTFVFQNNCFYFILNRFLNNIPINIFANIFESYTIYFKKLIIVKLRQSTWSINISSVAYYYILSLLLWLYYRWRKNNALHYLYFDLHHPQQRVERPTPRIPNLNSFTMFGHQIRHQAGTHQIYFALLFSHTIIKRCDALLVIYKNGKSFNGIC